MAAIFLCIGIILLGLVLMRKFSESAKDNRLGSFTLLPLAGFAYLAGILLTVVGTLMLLVMLALQSG